MMIQVQTLVMLLKITPNKNICEETLYISHPHNLSKKDIHTIQSPILSNNPIFHNLCSFVFIKDSPQIFISHDLFEIQRFSHTTLFVIMGNEKNRRLRRIES